MGVNSKVTHDGSNTTVGLRTAIVTGTAASLQQIVSMLLSVPGRRYTGVCSMKVGMLSSDSFHLDLSELHASSGCIITFIQALSACLLSVTAVTIMHVEMLQHTVGDRCHTLSALAAATVHDG